MPPIDRTRRTPAESLVAPLSAASVPRGSKNGPVLTPDQALPEDFDAFFPPKLPERPPLRPSKRVSREALRRIKDQNGPTTTYVPHKKAWSITKLPHKISTAWKVFLARRAYAKVRDKAIVKAGHHVGKMVRHYVNQQGPDALHQQWMVLERLFSEGGGFKGAFGEGVIDGAPKIMSKVIATREVRERLRKQRKSIGRDVVLPGGEVVKTKKMEISAMVGISAMSFPQLSASSILSLLYVHIKAAKEGAPFPFNTGEGGPDLHLALLEGDMERLRSQIISHGITSGELKENSIDHGSVEAYLERLMKVRNRLFAEFTPEDLNRAQLTVQFGPALNGARLEDDEGRTFLNYGRLEELGNNPYVGMVEFKVKQAAKRGSKVASDKMGHIPAGLRRVSPGMRYKSPVLSDEMATYEDIAAMVVAAKKTTGKPVSLKFAVGDIENIYEFLEYLHRHGAMPDHIQIDGAGKYLTPGSGNAPPTGTAGDTSLASRDGTVVVDLILKRLGARDDVHLAMSGEVQTPAAAAEAMALGADSVMAARTWMAMALGCKAVGDCDSGACPYGITSRQGTVFAHSLDPMVVGPKGANSAMEWYDHGLILLAETGSVDWRLFRHTHGLHTRQTKIRLQGGFFGDAIQDVYGPKRLRKIFRDDIMTRKEVQSALHAADQFHGRYELFDTVRRLDHFLDGMLTQDPSKAEQVQAFRMKRFGELKDFLSAAKRSGAEIRDFIRSEIPAELLTEGLHDLPSDPESLRQAITKSRHPQLRVIHGEM